MIKQTRDTKVLESVATLTTTGHGKTLLLVLKEELEAIKELWVDGDGTRDDVLRGRAKAIKDLILFLQTAETTAERLKQRQ